VLLLDEPFGALDPLTRGQVRDELGDHLAELELPTLLVTHAFDDATSLARRVAIIDRGRLLQVGSPSQLLAEPADATVAALTGANVLEGTATPTQNGSSIRLQGGGVIESATPASGPVYVTIQPWQLELAAPDGCDLTETVLGVLRDRGAEIVRLGRVTVQARSQDASAVSLPEGSVVGVRADPRDVRVLRRPR
jgi:ABC-type sulfate/molybdate transport systems ATPase subunit